MNYIRSRIATGTLIGQWRGHALEHVGVRRMCNKPQQGPAETPPAVPAQAPGPQLGFKIPGYSPSNMDRKILIWSGRFKTQDQIPELVSFEMIDAARNKVRVKTCYIMMAVTIGACLVTVILGKRAAGRHESLTSQNMEKKARWREEVQKEKDTAAAAAAAIEAASLTAKAQ